MATEGWKPAEGMGSRFNGQVLGTFGRFGVLSVSTQIRAQNRCL